MITMLSRPLRCLTACFIFFLFSCLINIPSAYALKVSDKYATKGTLDLREWNFETRGAVSLTGQWQFHWMSLADPSDIRFAKNTDKNKWYTVPGSWHDFVQGEKGPGSYGFATLALRVKLGSQKQRLGLKLREVHSAYRIFINGRPVQRVGVVAKTREDMAPEYRQVMIDLPENVPEIDIVIHISNFHHRLGGPWSRVVIGTKAALEQHAFYRQISGFFMIGSITMMGLYHFCLFVLRRSYTPALYLSILCGLITMRTLVTNEQALHKLVPAIPWEILIKAEYLGFYLAVPAFGMFIHSLFPKEFSRTWLRGFQGIAASFSFLVLFSPARIFSHSVQAYQVTTLIFFLYLMVVYFKAIRAEREGIAAIIFGTVFLFSTFMNDLLYANSLLKTAYFSQAGMFVFIFSHAIVLAQGFSKNFLTIERQTGQLMGVNSSLGREIQVREALEISLRESYEQFKKSRIALILGLAKLAESRDTNTGTHLERIREYVKILTLDLAETKEYASYISSDYLQDIYHSSILHDIGKVGIPDAILHKPGKLTDQEFEIMKTHTLIGGDAITQVASTIKKRSFLTLARDIAYYHHERWDGNGYPKGLAQKEIPLCARISALADVYDALTSNRPYKPALLHETARGIIIAGRGRQFDPDLVDAFCRQSENIRRVREKLQAG